MKYFTKFTKEMFNKIWMQILKKSKVLGGMMLHGGILLLNYNLPSKSIKKLIFSKVRFNLNQRGQMSVYVRPVFMVFFFSGAFLVYGLG